MLLKVRAILGPLVSSKPLVPPDRLQNTPATRNPVADETAPKEIPLENRFAELSCETEDLVDPEDDMLDASDIPEPPTAASAPASSKPRFAPEQDRLEALGEVLDFLVLVRDLREEIQALWRRYRDGEVELIPASVATNTALEQIRLAYNVLAPVLAAHFDDNPEKIVPAALRFISRIGPLKFDPNRRLEDIKPKELEALAVHELCLSPAMLMLYRDVSFHFTGILHSLDGIDHAGVYDDAVGADAHLFRRWRNNGILMGEAFLQYLAVLSAGTDVMGDSPMFAELNVNPFLSDEMALEMSRFDQRGEWSLLGLVHAQIYADIILSAGREAGRRASVELKSGARHLLDRLERAGCDPRHYTHPDLFMKGPPYAHLIAIAGIRLKPWSNPDTNPVHEEIKAYNEEILYDLDLPAVPDTSGRFVDYSPMFCGLQLLSMQLDLRRRTADLVRDQHIFTPCAHLYYAARIHAPNARLRPISAPNDDAIAAPAKDGSEFPAWSLMDAAIKLHGGWKIFAGHEPQTYKDVAYSLQLSAGLKGPMLGFVRHGIPGHPLFDRGEPLPSPEARVRANALCKELFKAAKGGSMSKFMGRDTSHLEAVCPALDVLSAKYAPDLSRPAGSYLDLRRLESMAVPNAALPHTDSSGTESIARGPASMPQMTANSSKKNRRKVPRRGSGDAEAPLDVAAISSIIHNCLARERESLDFDYIQLHVECMRVLRAMRTANADWMPAWLDIGWLTSDPLLKNAPPDMKLEFIPAAILQLAIAPDGERNGDDILRRVWPKGDLRMCVLDRMVETMEKTLQEMA